ncbi:MULTISPECIES: hypothetical protein [unclassified Anabaena]|uniref:hypothetical protein n=1 Tax=unclassified Anabaena TaxID=2619674 RepID=UPI002B1F4728|nr:hypothetical protein [Anabaena sp. UHCC 0399]MEA5567196.1 hypothetical protein [Anabaena sp. UHCC 0399]
MTANTLLSNLFHKDTVKLNSQEINLPLLQDKFYSFFIENVNTCSPEDVLQEFKVLFIDCLKSGNFHNVPAIQKIVSFNNEQEFRHTLKRCCYILINNWAAKRKHKYIQELINLFAELPNFRAINTFKELNLYRQWLENFINSQDYQELKIFNNYKNDHNSKGHWSDRYAAYLLVVQSLDTDKPKEQQEAAIKLYRQMKDKYKFDLAMYIARSQSVASSSTRYNNPSILGDNVLHLIKRIVVKKGKFSHENLANIFLKQTENQSLKEFKTSLQKYLFFSVGNQAVVSLLQQSFKEKFLLWKPQLDKEIINRNLLLRVCNKLIDYLTIENRHEPSELFILLVSQGHPLTLVIILLKIIFISKNSRSHLETRIADLISYYQHQSEDECQWVIHFIEFFNITFAIYAENVDYNLLKMQKDESVDDSQGNLDIYRVFSQVKEHQKY